MTVLDGPWRVRCGKPKTDGKPCQRWALKGTDHCSMHPPGSAAVDVVHPDDVRPPLSARQAAKARQQKLYDRMAEMAEQAMDTVSDVLGGPRLVELADGSTVLFKPDVKDMLSAAKLVLDRTVPPKLEIEDTSPAHRDIDEEIRGEIERVRWEAQQQAIG